jgi:hypothetical protein
MHTALRIWGLLLAATTVAVAEMRVWTFKDSDATLRAEVSGFSGDTVVLKKENGEKVSLRIAYLVDSDRAYLAAERSRQWKQVEILSLDDATSARPYKKCSVQGSSVKGEILVSLLPATVETVLNSRNRQFAQITNLTAQIEAQKSAVHQANATAQTTASRGRAYRRLAARERAQASQMSGDLKTAQANLAKLQKAYDEGVKKTKSQTTVKMKDTGIVFNGLAVWECLDPRKPPE